MAKKQQRKGFEWMTGQEAAKTLGVTRPTVIAMAARGEIGSIAVAGLVFVNRADVTAKAEQKAA
jgi:excisionase family DNA binding protein